MIARLDAWAERTVFWPLIIVACQRLGCGQWIFGRGCSVAFWLLLFASSRKPPLAFTILWGLGLVGSVIGFRLLGNLPYHEPGWVRWMWWIVLLFLIAMILLFAGPPTSLLPTFAMLFHCYAATLPGVPPRDDRKREPSRKVKHA